VSILYFLFIHVVLTCIILFLLVTFRKTGWANQQSTTAGIQEVRSDQFPPDSNEKVEKVNQVLTQLTGSGLTTMLSQVDPVQQQVLLAAGPAGALGILPSAQLASVADAALDLALGNVPSSDALLPPVNGAAAAAAASTTESSPVNAPAAAAAASPVPPSNANDAKVVGRIEQPSNHILVHNMFDKDEETEQGWEEDIKLDFEEECAQYGKISSVVVMSKEVGGKMYASFEAVDGAMNCAKNLAGRWFDKRQLRVEFVDSIPSS
jgi:RNA-binding protein 39